MATFDRTRYRESGGVKRTKIYQVWDGMIQRCSNKNHKHYHRYGGRGIAVCDKWRCFDYFYQDMGDPPEGMQIDRENNDADYEPSNCRWATSKINNRNKSDNHIITYYKKSKTLEEWGEITGIKANTILTRIRRGWPIGESLGYMKHHNKAKLTNEEKKQRVRSCIDCGAQFTPRLQQIKNNQGRYCSLKCSRKNSNKIIQNTRKMK